MRKALLLILTVLCILLIVPMAQSQVGTAAIRVVVDHDFRGLDPFACGGIQVLVQHGDESGLY